VRRIVSFIVFLLMAVPIMVKAQERIISLAPHITEVLFAVGAGPEIVGVVEYSDFPEAAKQIQTIGNSERLNYEQILALRPSLVVAWQSGNGEESINRMRELGLNVFSYEPQTMEDVAESLRVLGELSGHSQQGNEQADLFMWRLHRLKSSYSDVKKIGVFYQLGDEPHMTLNGEHLVSDVIELCGGENIFADAIPLVPRISVESVIRLNPAVIIGPSMANELPEWLEDWRNWPSIDAARQNHLFSINPDLMHRHSPRILDGAEQMCEILDLVRERL